MRGMSGMTGDKEKGIVGGLSEPDYGNQWNA